ncbi:MAG: GspE/PulE family protein [Candidatus Wallbacteria bacterium]|nr:GspE/PulE family protein [Candidatus Wallbacteria bacterium]
MDHELQELRRQSSDTPVVKFVNVILKEAIDNRASDIHLDCLEEGLCVRFRIDGVLFEKMKPPAEMQKAIISRVKILSSLDIGNTRVFQDGRFQMRMEERQVDFRVSVVPGVYGENIVIRILDKGGRFIELDKLGFSDSLLSVFQKTAAASQGLSLVTGPTGSGKTSTLYAVLRLINAKEKKVITLEDPVEYKLPYLTQIQVDRKADVDFGNGLRAILRHDPDVLLVGEMRDEETAHLGIGAAMTGHLVLSTLHTNDAVSSLSRLLSLGVKMEQLVSSLRLIVAQRLVRCLCPYCKKEGPADAETKETTGLSKVFLPAGCPRCNHAGYLGRTAISEHIWFDMELKKKLPELSDQQKLRSHLETLGFHSLAMDGLEKVRSGLTTMTEIRKVIWED